MKHLRSNLTFVSILCFFSIFSGGNHDIECSVGNFTKVIDTVQSVTDKLQENMEGSMIFSDRTLDIELIREDVNSPDNLYKVFFFFNAIALFIVGAVPFFILSVSRN